MLTQELESALLQRCSSPVWALPEKYLRMAAFWTFDFAVLDANALSIGLKAANESIFRLLAVSACPLGGHAPWSALRGREAVL